MCDPERVAQVMRILIDNALTHTPEGTDMVVSAGRRTAACGSASATSAPGVRRAMLPHIFEPFITSDDAQGSGPRPGDRPRARGGA
jgi:signal transduction histidine kinase